METHEKQIERLEAALKIAKLKIWVTFIIGLFIVITLSVSFFYIWIKMERREFNIPETNELVIPLNTPPTGYGNRIPQNQIPNVEQGFTNYQVMLSGGSVTIPSGTTPTTFPLNTVYSQYELISLEALARMLKQGQTIDPNTSAIIQPAYIMIRDCKMGDPTTPRVKKYLMMLDGSYNVIEDANGKIIYNELMRCPTHCPVL